MKLASPVPDQASVTKVLAAVPLLSPVVTT